MSYLFLRTAIPNQLLGVNKGILLSDDNYIVKANSYRQWMHTYAVEGNFAITPLNKVYIRVSYNYSPAHTSLNYSQFQIGFKKSLVAVLNGTK